jgi:murein DD-endopeptidase MepM/ murein hydrolase activator NlpD
MRAAPVCRFTMPPTLPAPTSVAPRYRRYHPAAAPMAFSKRQRGIDQAAGAETGAPGKVETRSWRANIDGVTISIQHRARYIALPETTSESGNLACASCL